MQTVIYILQTLQNKLESAHTSTVTRLAGSGHQLVLLNNTAHKQWLTPLAYVITTSGTTATPKIVQVPHQCIVPNITHIRLVFFEIMTGMVFKILSNFKVFGIFFFSGI